MVAGILGIQGTPFATTDSCNSEDDNDNRNMWRYLLFFHFAVMSFASTRLAAPSNGHMLSFRISGKCDSEVSIVTSLSLCGVLLRRRSIRRIRSVERVEFRQSVHTQPLLLLPLHGALKFASKYAPMSPHRIPDGMFRLSAYSGLLMVM